MAQQQDGAATIRFFDAHQRETIEAAMSRIIPSGEQPGAREAGTVDFVDHYLSGIDYIYAKPDGTGFEKLEGKRADAWQHRVSILQRKYTEGVVELDRRAREKHGGVEFARLSEQQQDDILTEMERPQLSVEQDLESAKATAGWAPAEPAMQQVSTEIELDFFPLLALHTRQGFYADSIYGGNRDHVGWKLIGFDGPTSLAETHAGRYTTLPYFADEPGAAEKGDKSAE